jgi:HK97 family phage major capsid protein
MEMLDTDVLEVRSIDPEPDDDPDLAAATRALEQLRQDWQEFRDAAPTAEQIIALNRRLDELERRSQRPGATAATATAVEQAELETRAFASYLRRGRDHMTADEVRALNTTDDGAVVPETFIAELIRNLVEMSPMRQVARVMQVSGSPVLLPKRTGELTAAIVAEGADAATTEPTYGQQSVTVYEARCFVDISNALLEDSAFDMSSELAFDFSEEFGRLEGQMFVNGTGSGQPQGFTVSSDFTTITGTADLADDLIDLFHSVPSFYARRGTWLMNRATMGEVRKAKTSGTGVYLWADSLAPGNPPTLLGRPIVEMSDIATIGVGSPTSKSIAFGDWSQAFRVLDRVGLTVLRDPYSVAVKSQTRFHARRRFGGALVKGEAVKGLLA